MAPPKGFPKPPGSGRKKGQKVRPSLKAAIKTEAERAIQAMGELGIDPWEALLRIAQHAAAVGNLALAAYCHKSLLPFKYPTLSRVQVSPITADEAAALDAAVQAARVRAGAFSIPAPLELPEPRRSLGPVIDVTPTVAREPGATPAQPAQQPTTPPIYGPRLFATLNNGRAGQVPGPSDYRKGPDHEEA